MKFGTGSLVAACVAAALLAGWVYLTRPDHKYRLTVDVDTPNGVKSASNVMAVYQGKISIGGIGGGVGLKGEAVFVDLGQSRNLIAILAHGDTGGDVDNISRLAMNAYRAAGRNVEFFSDTKNLSGTVPVAGRLIPTLVTVTDITNPDSARVVNPANFESSFGPGYRLRGVSIAVLPVGLWPFDFGGPLGEPVTRNIEKRLPFLASHKEELRRIMLDMPPRLQPRQDIFLR